MLTLTSMTFEMGIIHSLMNHRTQSIVILDKTDHHI